MNRLQKITSRDNPSLVKVRKIRDGKVPGKIFVEGQRLAAEALRSRLTITDCFVAEEFRNRELLREAGERSRISELPEKLFHSIADTQSPQGIVLIAERPQCTLAAIEGSLASSHLPMVLYFSEINNPSNLGAVLRTAEAAGVAGVITSRRSADIYSTKALRSAMGATFRLSVVENIFFDDVLKWAGDHELITTATIATAELSYAELNWKRPRLLIFGSEAHGLSIDHLEAVTERISIPLENDVESLNLAVSAGILLFEAKRQART